MTTLREAAQQALEALIENARLLGATQAKKGSGCYSQEDARLERAWHEGIAKHSAALRAALAQQAEPYPLPDDLYDSKDWRAGDYAERVAWLHAMYESAKKERDALLYPPEPLWPPTGLEPRGCPMPGACSCPSESVRSTHSEECWQWHQACAVAAVIRLRRQFARMSELEGTAWYAAWLGGTDPRENGK